MSDDSADVLARIDATLHQVDAADAAWRRAVLARPGMAVYEPRPAPGPGPVRFRPGAAAVGGPAFRALPPGERPAVSERREPVRTSTTPRMGLFGPERGVQRAGGTVFGRSPTCRGRLRRRWVVPAAVVVVLALAGLVLAVTGWGWVR